ncbi:hypothetical protein [Burkholderia pseudomallei]|uniref:hypothetical protein n=1 Tax=Burkholderia pseudomallei TaxID=28450 RepID=UPI0022D3581B|nr:hypothetical protein [Burkholderia pseudomallei]MDA0561714.1 hypothetical protein [Burkholderia pseudomallei]
MTTAKQTAKKATKKGVRKAASRRVIVDRDIYNTTPWVVHFGELQRIKSGPGRPPNASKTEHLFRVVGEKLPFEALAAVKRHLRGNGYKSQGVYVAHDSMGCPRYIGRGDIFQRLVARKKSKQLELEYFSFYVVTHKKHEREIETLLIRAAAFLLEFNDRKKRIGIAPGSVSDFESGTVFYERQYERGAKPKP